MRKIQNAKMSGLERLGKDPVFDWYFCLTCFVIALAFVVLGDIAIFSNIVSPVTTIGITPTPQAHIDRAEIELLAKKLRTMDLDAASLSAAALRDPSTR
jgi:hypothetical protein